MGRGSTARLRRARSLWRTRRWFADPQRYAAAAAVSDDIAARLLSRVDCARLAPLAVLDLGAGTGRAAAELSRRFPHAALLALDASEAQLAAATGDWRWWRRPLRIAGDAHRLPLADASVDLLFSNLMLPWCADAPLALAEMHRVLRPGGALFVSSLGPACLAALGAADVRLARLHWPLPDLRGLTDLLTASGFRDAVGDVEKLSVSYARRETLDEDLAALGLAAWRRAVSRGANAPPPGAVLGSDPGCDSVPAGCGNAPLQLPLEALFAHAWRAAEGAAGEDAARPLQRWPQVPGSGPDSDLGSSPGSASPPAFTIERDGGVR